MLEQGYGIVPNMVLFDGRVSDKQLRLFIYISSLCATNGYCRPSNDHLAEKFGVTDRTITRNITQLRKLGLIYTWYRVSKKNKNKKIRYIKLEKKQPTHELPTVDDLEKETDKNVCLVGGETDNNVGYNSTNLNNTITDSIEPTDSKAEVSISPKEKAKDILKAVKSYCHKNGLAYSGKGDTDRQRAHNIATANEYGIVVAMMDAKSEKKVTRENFALSIIKQSVQLEYWKGPLTSCEMIFKHYHDVYNLWMKKTGAISTGEHKDELDVYISQQEPQIAERLVQIKKQRSKQYPHKKPFSTQEQIDQYIADIKSGKL